MTFHGLSNQFKNSARDEQIAAEESRHFQNKAHSSRWHCRIGKIRMWTDKERYERALNNRNPIFRGYCHA